MRDTRDKRHKEEDKKQTGDKTRQDKTKQNKTKQDKTKQDKTRDRLGTIETRDMRQTRDNGRKPKAHSKFQQKKTNSTTRLV